MKIGEFLSTNIEIFELNNSISQLRQIIEFYSMSEDGKLFTKWSIKVCEEEIKFLKKEIELLFSVGLSSEEGMITSRIIQMLFLRKNLVVLNDEFKTFA